jgi:hypothetical protein
MRAIMVSGTLSNAPTGPKIQPQTTIDTVTTSADRPALRPIAHERRRGHGDTGRQQERREDRSAELQPRDDDDGGRRQEHRPGNRSEGMHDVKPVSAGRRHD